MFGHNQCGYISAASVFFINEKKDLIIQYQAKYEMGIDCGGRYVKIGPKMEERTAL